jgi:hypothetical protein
MAEFFQKAVQAPIEDEAKLILNDDLKQELFETFSFN